MKENEVYAILDIHQLKELLKKAKAISMNTYGGVVSQSTIILKGTIDNGFPGQVLIDMWKTIKG